MTKIATCLWFDGDAEAAAEFYVAVFRAMGQPAAIGQVKRLADGGVLTVTFTLAGNEYIGLNGGPHYSFTPAISLFVKCADQAEVDGFWDRLLEGGAPMQCGWLTDRFGLSWQIVPVALGEMLDDPDRQRADRVMQAMMLMVKLDVAALKRAYDGGA